MHPNTYWYLGLVVISLVLLLFLCLSGDRTHRFFLYLALVGFGYMAESVIYVFLGSYQYFPKVLNRDPVFDSNLGAITSNQFALPATAILIAVCHIGWKGILFASSIFVGIEWLFVKLQIYVHYWWKLSYTALGLPFYFAFAKYLYRRMAAPMRGFHYAIALALIVGALTGSLHVPPTMLIISRSYSPGWFASPGRESKAFATVNYIVVSLLVLGVTHLRWRMWIKYALLVTIELAWSQFLVKVGILHRLAWWDLPYYALVPCVLLRISTGISTRLKNGLTT